MTASAGGGVKCADRISTPARCSFEGIALFPQLAAIIRPKRS